MKTSWLYVLQCAADRYYVGTTDDLTARFGQHWAGTGPTWTKMYPPSRAVLVAAGKTALDEDVEVKRLMLERGVGAVRGGSYSQLALSEAQLLALQRELRHARGECFACGSDSHWVSGCPKRTAMEGNHPTGRSPAPAPAPLSPSPAPQNPFSSDGPHANPLLEQRVLLEQQQVQRERLRLIATLTVKDEPGSKGKCYRCGRAGHFARTCYTRTHVDGHSLVPDSSSSSSSSDLESSSSEDPCFRCGRTSHFARSCYARTDVNGRPL